MKKYFAEFEHPLWAKVADVAKKLPRERTGGHGGMDFVSQGPVGAIPRKVAGSWLPEQTWMAAGAGGQRLVVVPSLKLVAVRLAPVRGESKTAFNDRAWLRALLEPLAAAPAKPADVPKQSAP